MAVAVVGKTGKAPLVMASLGMAFVWPCMFSSTWYYEPGGYWSTVAQSHFFKLVVMLAAALACMVFSRQFVLAQRRYPRAVLVLGLGSAASNAANVYAGALGPATPLGPLVDVVTSAYTAVALVVVFFAWADWFGRMSFFADTPSLSSAVGVSVIATLTLMDVEHWFGWRICAICYLAISSLLWYRCRDWPARGDERAAVAACPSAHGVAAVLGSSGLLLVTGTLFAVGITLNGAAYQASGTVLAGAVGHALFYTFGILLATVLVMARSGSPLKPQQIRDYQMRSTAVFLVALTAVLAVPGALSLAGWTGIMQMTWRILVIVVFMVVLDLCYTESLDAVRAMGWLFLFNVLASNLVCGELLPRLFALLPIAVDPSTPSGSTAVGGALLVLASWALFALLLRRASRCSLTQPVVTAEGIVASQVLDRLSQEYGLTRREREVIALIDSSVSDAMIAERLGLSENTVGTHLYHAYRKLEVHSRQEVLDLVQRAKRECL